MRNQSYASVKQNGLYHEYHRQEQAILDQPKQTDEEKLKRKEERKKQNLELKLNLQKQIDIRRQIRESKTDQYSSNKQELKKVVQQNKEKLKRLIELEVKIRNALHSLKLPDDEEEEDKEEDYQEDYQEPKQIPTNYFSKPVVLNPPPLYLNSGLINEGVQFSKVNGMGTATKKVTNPDGSVTRIVNIGVPRHHKMADTESKAGQSNLYNLKIGNVSLKCAPTFMINVDPKMEDTDGIRIVNNGDVISITVPDIESHAESIQTSINSMTPQIDELFKEFETQKKQKAEKILDFVRRLQNMRDEELAKQNQALQNAEIELKMVKIEQKHFKRSKVAKRKVQVHDGQIMENKNQNNIHLEPPECSICVDHIKLGSEGMLMPCEHIFHPDCLQTWLNKTNTCPVCRHVL